MLEQSTRYLGLEGSGVVQAVGTNVHNILVGDRVMFMSTGCFSTQKVVPANACVRIDQSMSFEEAAAMPCVYVTAAMALFDKSQLQRGQVGDRIPDTPHTSDSLFSLDYTHPLRLRWRWACGIADCALHRCRHLLHCGQREKGQVPYGQLPHRKIAYFSFTRFLVPFGHHVCNGGSWS